MDLLKLPVEVIQKIFPYLPLKDLRNLARCSSAMFKIAIPILYRSLSLYFAEPIDYVIQPVHLEEIMDISDSTFGGFRKLYILKTKSLSPRALRAMVSDMDDVALRLIIKRFGTGQLRKIRLDNNISSRTLALILKRQPNLNELELSDLGALKELNNPYAFPPSLPTQPLRLTSFSVGEVLKWAALIVLRIIRQSASTLKKLQIGDPQHNDTSRLTNWEDTPDFGSETEIMAADGWPPYRSEEEEFTSFLSLLNFGEIKLPSLELLYIIHDPQFAKFVRFTSRIISGCHRLKTLRISTSNDPYNLIQRLVDTGSQNIESLQIGHCSNPRAFSNPPIVPPAQGFLPQISQLKTLQITNETHRLDILANFFGHTAELRRLWLNCIPAHCDPTECPIMSHFLEYNNALSRISLSHENWPLLEELAFSHPGWSKVPLLPSLKILRLLDWFKPNDFRNRFGRQSASLSKMQTYVSTLYDFSKSNYNRPPDLKLIVMDEEYQTGDCFRNKTVNKFPKCYGVENGRVVMLSSMKDVFRQCEKAGCSPYLVLGGLPTPEQVWGDEDKDHIYSEVGYLPVV
ncbi:hypothetical protein TWF506_003691 [Arthrobotrys conoides]|uniref:F-box domain-containing protein n=1 Tax=Arthrobotrys conoides TaxID=74498 RepID=A0AAN8N496_9PEZI